MRKVLTNKYFKRFFDFLMVVIPILELSELLAVIPMEWLPWYMLATVLIRRGLRWLEEYYAKMDSK